MQLDDICAEVALKTSTDAFGVREAVTSFLARAAEVFDDQGVVDLGEVGRLHRVKLPRVDGDGEDVVTVHRPWMEPTLGRYRGIRFDERTRLGPVRRLEG